MATVCGSFAVIMRTVTFLGFRKYKNITKCPDLKFNKFVRVYFIVQVVD